MAKQPSKGRKRPKKTDEKPKEAAKSTESVTKMQPLVDAIPPEVHSLSTESGQSTDSQTVVEALPEPAPEPQPQPATQPAPAQSSGSGFLPLALGGLLAGVIGFAVATFTTPAADDSVTLQLTEQAATISQLQARLQDLPSVDTSELETTFDGQVANLNAALDDISARLDVLEARPAVVVSEGTDGSEAVLADMDALRAQLAEMADAAQTELDEARATAAAIEEYAALAARNAAARAALARVQTAMESGSPIGAALGDLEEALGNSAPAELLAVQDGVATLTSLQDSFPDVARAALATARREGVAGEDTTGFGAFLRNQFDVRSTAPRDGDDADAVLSRAEAALRSGRLADALAEISALPEVSRAEMSDWLATAEARAAAVSAVDVLSTQLSDN